jgi:hypothetical protein
MPNIDSIYKRKTKAKNGIFDVIVQSSWSTFNFLLLMTLVVNLFVSLLQL